MMVNTRLMSDRIDLHRVHRDEHNSEISPDHRIADGDDITRIPIISCIIQIHFYELPQIRCLPTGEEED